MPLIIISACCPLCSYQAVHLSWVVGEKVLTFFSRKNWPLGTRHVNYDQMTLPTSPFSLPAIGRNLLANMLFVKALILGLGGRWGRICWFATLWCLISTLGYFDYCSVMLKGLFKFIALTWCIDSMEYYADFLTIHAFLLELPLCNFWVIEHLNRALKTPILLVDFRFLVGVLYLGWRWLWWLFSQN